MDQKQIIKNPTQDKTPMQSKKFVAYLLSEIGWKGLLFYIIHTHPGDINHTLLVLLLTVVITSGVIQIGYILGQVALDKYITAAVDILDKDEEDKKEKDPPKEA